MTASPSSVNRARAWAAASVTLHLLKKHGVVLRPDYVFEFGNVRVHRISERKVVAIVTQDDELHRFDVCAILIDPTIERPKPRRNLHHPLSPSRHDSPARQEWLDRRRRERVHMRTITDYITERAAAHSPYRIQSKRGQK